MVVSLAFQTLPFQIQVLPPDVNSWPLVGLFGKSIAGMVLLYLILIFICHYAAQLTLPVPAVIVVILLAPTVAVEPTSPPPTVML